ncbi:MAG: type 1 glutamine amidotransferase [Bdellovibrionaceae bacterium]|nr:type 1 glutamine amidotransferase [Pseudobdellovibrionaceae bacterium]
MKTIGIVQHTVFSAAGTAVPWVKARGFRSLHRRMSEREPLPKVDEVDALIIAGGEMNVDQEHLHPWLREEKRLIEAALKQGKPVVGLCLGGQLLAEVLGAKVGPRGDWEAGWLDVDLQVKPGLAGFEAPGRLKVFQWHGYVFETPAGATRLAGNAWWPHQAFVWDNLALGFQFHPETTLAWSEECANDAELPKTGHVQSREEILRDGPLHQPPLQRWFERTLEGFLIR